MATTTYTDAVDEIYGVLNNAWDDSEAIVGYVPEIRWPGKVYNGHPPNEKFWVRPSYRTVKDSQATLADINGQRRYQQIGLFILQVFAPKNDPNNPVDVGRKLCEMIRTAFRESSPNVWFRDQKIDELNPTPESYPFNVVVTCTFETLE